MAPKTTQQTASDEIWGSGGRESLLLKSVCVCVRVWDPHAPLVCGWAWNVEGEDIMIKVGKSPEFQG